jgi:hypothetical protein
LPRNENDKFDTPPDTCAYGNPLRIARAGLDEGEAIAVVLLHAGGNGEDIRVEDDVLGREAHFVDEDVVGALADRDLALDRVGLPLLVKGHHHHRGAIAAHDAGVIDERLLAFLQRYRVHHRLALQAFQAGLDHGELR